MLLAMARHVLGGPEDEGRAPYQIALTVCDACGRGEQLGGGEPVPIGAEVVAMAQCNAQHIGHLLPRAANENGARDSSAAAPANDAHVDAADHPSADPRESTTAVVTSPARVVPLARAKQTIPPAVRRAVLARDRHRCRVPGCTHATFLDVHHVVPRSEGGSNHPANLIGICSAHHRAAHRGELLIESSPDGSPLFRHADGSAYGQAVAPRVADAQTQVFAARRHLGFREREVKAVLAELRADPEAARSNGRAPAARSPVQDSPGSIAPVSISSGRELVSPRRAGFRQMPARVWHLTLPRASQTLASCGITDDPAQVLPMGRLMPSPGLFVDRTEKSVVIGGLMELSGAEATLARALSIQKTINLTWTQTFSDGYAVRCNIAVRYRGPGSGASNVTQIQAARIRKICGSVKSSSEAATIRTGVDLLAVSDLGQRTTLRVIFARMPRVRRVLAAIKELRGERMSTVRMLLVAAGALTAESVTWVLWGLFTPGDYFAGGSPGVWVTLAVAGFAGAIAAGRVRSRWAAALLLVSALLCSAFWLVVPDAWWASSPPPRPPTPIMR